MSERPQRRGSLARRLLLSHIAVALAMALTMVIVAVVAGPPLFEAHMRRAGEANPRVLMHSRDALAAAGLLALGLGLVIAATGAIAVSILIARRLRQTLSGIGDAAARIAEGDYSLRVGDADSVELTALADNFNAMAARLAAVESTRRRLLTDLAHEIRTPLANMALCVESLEDGAMDPGPGAWTLLTSQIQRISNLAHDVGEVSAAEEGRLELHPELVDPRDLVASALAAVREAYGRKQVVLHLSSPPQDLVRVNVDPSRIGQVLSNLLTNALRHTPAGGTVTVSIGRSDDWVRIEVADSGDGIAPEHLPHIFERFYRVDSARDRGRGGTGVGLAISRAIVSAHGGRLTAMSAGLGQGSTLRIDLPYATPGLGR